jgi:ferric-dicitrate binding protein FerR (iron transport regulator)
LASVARHRPTTRRLWGHDAKNGNFTITGNRGAATVRGTTWEVVDTCTTTTVSVSQGVVDVTGFGNTKPLHATVRAGQRVVLRAG